MVRRCDGNVPTAQQQLLQKCRRSCGGVTEVRCSRVSGVEFLTGVYPLWETCTQPCHSISQGLLRHSVSHHRYHLSLATGWCFPSLLCQDLEQKGFGGIAEVQCKRLGNFAATLPKLPYGLSTLNRPSVRHTVIEHVIRTMLRRHTEKSLTE